MKQRVVIVEPYDLIARGLASRLRSAGLTCEITRTVHETIASLTPDLGCLVIDGSLDASFIVFELREMRRSKCPVFLMVDRKLGTAREIEAGFRSITVVNKPLEMSELVRGIVKACSERSATIEALDDRKDYLASGIITLTGCYPDNVDDIQRRGARIAVERNDNNKSAAARMLGVGRRWLQHHVGED